MKSKQTEMKAKKKREKKVTLGKEFIEQMGGGEKALAALLGVGSRAFKALQASAVLNIRALLAAEYVLSDKCLIALNVELGRLTGQAASTAGNEKDRERLEAISQITELLYQSADGPLVFGLLTRLRGVVSEADAECMKKYSKGVTADVVDTLTHIGKKAG